MCQHWGKTFSHYIDTYIRRPTAARMHIPGEHHFVATYLVPRLATFDFLGVPFYVNPDGMKAIPGDIVYYHDLSEAEGSGIRFRLGIEVKIMKAKFSSFEYNQWIAPNGNAATKPQLFIGISSDGMLFSRWSAFTERFLAVVYRDQPPPRAIPAREYTRAGPLARIAQGQALDGLFWWSHNQDGTTADANEADFMAKLETECRRAVNDRPSQ